MAGTRRSFDFVMDASLPTDPAGVEGAAAALRARVEASEEEEEREEEEEEGEEGEEEEEGHNKPPRTASALLSSSSGKGGKGGKGKGAVEEAVWMSSYIPRSLHELSSNSFEEARRIAAGEREQGYAAAVRGMLVVEEEEGEEGEGEQQPPPSVSGEQLHPSSTSVRSTRLGGRRRRSVHTKSGGIDGALVEGKEEQGRGEWRRDCPSVMSCWRALCVLCVSTCATTSMQHTKLFHVCLIPFDQHSPTRKKHTHRSTAARVPLLAWPKPPSAAGIPPEREGRTRGMQRLRLEGEEGGSCGSCRLGCMMLAACLSQ